MTGASVRGHVIGMSTVSADELVTEIDSIGLARFVGRINSGLIDPEQGYAAIEKFVAAEKRRPLLSRFGYALSGRSDTGSPETRF